ncbi:TldD/PmbA family protein [Haloechinothrix sp. LS1_15]|uniref:TldD/PmbA family protein n=1 Tax=Haloechinothrix sp. LS1_15 TaxID=2652248 RepID=UPI00294B3D90|nr:TldD/PmbA family protein [Haloechinothrix sp. LS1_15]
MTEPRAIEPVATGSHGAESELVPRAVLEQILTELRRAGAEYGDVFVEDRRARSLLLEEDSASYGSYGSQRGAGIRAVRGDTSVHACTERLSPSELLSTARRVVELLGTGVPNGSDIRLAPVTATTPSPVRTPSDSASWSARVGYLERAVAAGRAADPMITGLTARLFESAHDLQIATTEGSYATEHRSRLRLRVQATARDRRGRTGHGSWAPGGTGGLELLERVARPEEVAAEAARQAVVLLDARPAPAGERTMVVGPGVGGVLLHEVCGHPLEADCLHLPGAAFDGMLGSRVADDRVTIIDDQTVPAAWGSAAVDDEATVASRTVLVDGGVLAGYLHDRDTARTFAGRRTGNARRASFRHLPVPRMTNTFIAAGDDDPDEIIGETPDGIYARSFSGGVADPATGSFTFTVREGYRITNGKLAEPLADVAIVGNGREVLSGVDRVGHDLSLVPSVCGKEGQKAMVSVGQPTIRVRSVTVGGSDVGTG